MPATGFVIALACALLAANEQPTSPGAPAVTGALPGAAPATNQDSRSPATPGLPDAEPGSVPPSTEQPEPPTVLPPPLPPPAPEPTPRLYGDRGTPELALGIGYSSTTGLLGAVGFRYFVLTGLAPGFEGTYVSGGTSGSPYGLALASLRLVPLRMQSVAVVLTGRAGRVFLGHHDDGWGAGGAAGLLFILSQGLGIELGYEALKLLPASFCADLRTCLLHGPVLGLRLVL